MRHLRGMASYVPLQKQTVFTPGHKSYRIPALHFRPEPKVFLAFAEERIDNVDENAESLVMRRGVFNEVSREVEWGQTETLHTAQLQGYRSMNPCPVFDEETKTLFLFFIAVEGHISEMYQIKNKKNLVHLCYITSKDEGRTWGGVIDLTETVIGKTHKEWATFAVGPGHGLQLQDEFQTLIIPAYAYIIRGANECPKPQAFCFISQDHGHSWSIGGYIQEENVVECQMECIESRGKSFLYCNARTNQGMRVQAVSHNCGQDFREGKRVEKLTEPPFGCQGSIIGFPSPTASSHPETWLLFSHPHNAGHRKDLGIYLNTSPANSDMWAEPVIIYKGPAAYSDLQFMGLGPDNSPEFACLFECGTDSPYNEIAFTTFTLRHLYPDIK
ncbi:sialidase-2-like isoform X2 [Protopterus annectens]|uniref:sialidase-2-like isoform X2 n=1 Tax=Protopterus annectens TaxID=7888 RepID=UPI001CFAA2A8|nr:sialidase-2-like isoform X2 [Protopterus annectens]